MKIGMLQRGEKFSQEEKEQLVQIQMNLRVVAKTLITFHQLEHTYDRSFLTMYMEELETSLKNGGARQTRILQRFTTWQKNIK